MRGLGAEGVVVAFDGDWAHLEIRGKRMRVRRSDLEPLGASRSRKPRAESPRARPPAHGSTARLADLDRARFAEVNVIGQRVDEAIDAAEKALDQALLSGATRLRVIHGHGTGTAARRVARALPGATRRSRRCGAGGKTEGGNGATILELRIEESVSGSAQLRPR